MMHAIKISLCVSYHPLRLIQYVNEGDTGTNTITSNQKRAFNIIFIINSVDKITVYVISRVDKNSIGTFSKRIQTVVVYIGHDGVDIS